MTIDDFASQYSKVDKQSDSTAPHVVTADSPRLACCNHPAEWHEGRSCAGDLLHCACQGSSPAPAGGSPTPDPGPRVWSLPEEPGPEVKAVRDTRGHLWVRRVSSWDPTRFMWKHELSGHGKAWAMLLADRGPVTDATSETTEDPA